MYLYWISVMNGTIMYCKSVLIKTKFKKIPGETVKRVYHAYLWEIVRERRERDFYFFYWLCSLWECHGLELNTAQRSDSNSWVTRLWYYQEVVEPLGGGAYLEDMRHLGMCPEGDIRTRVPFFSPLTPCLLGLCEVSTAPHPAMHSPPSCTASLKTKDSRVEGLWIETMSQHKPFLLVSCLYQAFCHSIRRLTSIVTFRLVHGLRNIT